MTKSARALWSCVLLPAVLSAAGLEQPKARGIRTLSREVFIKKGDRPVCTGFITYLHTTEPILMHCYGFEDFSDGYDDYGYQISRDNGRTWSAPVPFPCAEGAPIESGANGSGFFRSIKDGRLYWIGNLCVRGRRPKGNFPRTPLVVARVQEEPFGLIRDSIAVVDEQGPTEPDNVQMSNFRFYQDRETGDLVLFYTRYSERSAENWMDADYHRLRVRLD